MARLITVFLIVVFNIVGQGTLVHALSVGGISFNLLLITVVSFGLLRGKFEGAFIGLVIGLMIDIFYGSTMGFYSLLYLYIGFLCGYLNKALYRDNILIPIVLILVCDFMLNFIIFSITYLLRGKTDFPTYLVNIILPEMVYTALISIIMYKLYHSINNQLEYFERRKEDHDSNENPY